MAAPYPPAGPARRPWRGGPQAGAPLRATAAHGARDIAARLSYVASDMSDSPGLPRGLPDPRAASTLALADRPTRFMTSTERFDPASQIWTVVGTGPGCMRGLMVDKMGRAFIAHNGFPAGMVVVHTVTKTILNPNVPLPGAVTPVGI